MRRFGFVVASILLVSTVLFAQHTSGSSSASFSGSSSAAASHSSGGSFAASSGSHYASTSSTHTSAASASSHSQSTRVSTTKGAPQPERKSTRSFFHPFRKPKPVEHAQFPRRPCFKGNCSICPPGQSANGRGLCVVMANTCQAGLVWNGFSCGQNWWFNDCSYLAAQLAAQRRHMQGLNDPGQSLIYQTLRTQYDSCLARGGFEGFGGFSFYALNDGSFLDMP
jgi:hypothetical protein